ncbi:MAG: YkgJ family cysteine cluster protein [Desulfurococcaceae archaeon]
MIIPEQLPTFKCEMCGQCCRMSPISVLPHEVVILEKLAEVLSLEVKFEPGYMLHDSISKVNIALSFVMQLESGKCVFLKESKCSIHNIYKPYICRSFPYIPRHVKYNIDDINKYIYATTDHGLSLACPVVRRDRESLEKYSLRNTPFINVIIRYYKDGYNAAMEAENTRSLMLTLLSKIWREGFIEIETARPRMYVMNLYEFLRRFYPDLPNILGIDRVFSRMRTWM